MPRTGQLAEAKEVREALYRLIRALSCDSPPPVGEPGLVTSFAEPSPPALSVDLAGRLRRTGDLTAAMSAVARSGLGLYGEPERRLVRWCDDATCTPPFLDLPRGEAAALVWDGRLRAVSMD